MKHNSIFIFCIVWAMGCMVSSCNLDPNEGFSWNVDVLAPLATSSVGVSDILTDTCQWQTGTDQLVEISFRDTLTSFALDQFLRFPDSSLTRNFNLRNFRIADDTINQSISLGLIARELEANGDITGTLILFAHGSSLPSIPSQEGLSFNNIAIDGSDFFEFAKLDSGRLTINITNNFPLEIANVSFVLKNQSSGVELLNNSFPSIPPGSFVSETFDLSGKEVESSLLGQITNFDILGGTDVLIDTTDNVQIDLLVQGLKAREATAIFPTQTVEETTEPLTYNFQGEFSDVGLRKVKIKSGSIRADLFSTIEDTIKFLYSLPSVQKNGEIPSISRKILPALPGEISQLTEIQDLSGFVMDLTYTGSLVNTLTQYYKIDLVESGKLVSVDLEDSVYISYGLQNIQPAYVEGYLGKNQLDFEGSYAMEMFEELEIESLGFTRPSAHIIFFNSMGADIGINIRKIEGTYKDGNSIRLSNSALASPIQVLGPTLPDTFGTGETIIPLSINNSNIKEFFTLDLSEISYDIGIDYNINGDTLLANNFASCESEIGAIFELRFPLEGSLGQASMRDTTEVSFGEINVEKLKGGTMRFILQNQFPLEVSLEAQALDANGLPLKTLINGQIIQAGIPTGATGYVELPTESMIEVVLNEEELEQLIMETEKIAFMYRFSSQPVGTDVKVFADYTVNASLIGDFSFEAN